MKFDQIRQIINQWDPIGLFELNPIDDEYDDEVRDIENTLTRCSSVEAAAKAIEAIFKKSFGEDFQRPLSECKEIALKLMEG